MTFSAAGYDVDIQNKIVGKVTAFSDRVLRISDPAAMKEYVGKLKFPMCGIIYEGISSDGDSKDEGRDAFLSVALIILAESKARSNKQKVEATEIPSLLDATRQKILGKTSPSGRVWQFVVEIPIDLGDAGMAYYQKWKTKVVI